MNECDLSYSNNVSQCVKDAFDKNADILALLPSSEPFSDTQRLINANDRFDYPLPLLGGDAMYGGKIFQDVG